MFSEGDDYEWSDGMLVECVWLWCFFILRSWDRSNGIFFLNGELNSSIKSIIVR